MAAISSWDTVTHLRVAGVQREARDLVVMEVRDVTSIGDYFVICAGSSDRQVQSIAQGIEENLSEAGHPPLSVEGVHRGHWVLMDFSDVIVHIFYEPVREFYDLEGLWGHAPRVELPEPYSTLVEQFQAADNPLL